MDRLNKSDAMLLKRDLRINMRSSKIHDVIKLVGKKIDSEHDIYELDEVFGNFDYLKYLDYNNYYVIKPMKRSSK